MCLLCASGLHSAAGNMLGNPTKAIFFVDLLLGGKERKIL